MPRVYVAFILDMIIIFNKIINNSRPPAWYFSLTRTGNKEFTIVGLITIVIYNIPGTGVCTPVPSQTTFHAFWTSKFWVAETNECCPAWVDLARVD